MHVRAHLRPEKSTQDENECALYSRMTSRWCIMTFMKNFLFKHLVNLEHRPFHYGGANQVHIVDEARYWFRILSMTTPTVWYNVSLQCSYCDCQDFASKCKHLLAIRMIVERHMPSLCGSLPFIEHAAQM